MQNYYTPKSKHLTLTERRMIERWLQEGLSNREIARRLAKAPQTKGLKEKITHYIEQKYSPEMMVKSK
ncbi:helix-turn-helix domain-containing protein, partial [Streptococcus lutetiensis]